MKRPIAVRETFDAPIEYGYRFFDAPIDSPLRNAVFLTYDSAMQARDCYCQPIEREENEGFSNKETWAVALHLNNTQWMQKEYRSHREAIKHYCVGDAVPHCFAERLQKLVERWFGDFYSDAMGHYGYEKLVDIRLMAHDVGSLWRVDWKELAEHLMKD